MVPVALPLSPALVDHVTAVTPVLSEAVPLNTIDAAVVSTFVPAGELMVSVGAVESFVPGRA